jgi:hypothetical protein
VLDRVADFRWTFGLSVLQCNKTRSRADREENAMAGAKGEIITFKADDELLEALRGVPNRSEFIRRAILQALESSCPLCGGTGLLTPMQKRHWEEFSRSHPLRECDDCHEMHLVCGRGGRR